MGKTATLTGASLEFARSYFHDYYHGNPIPPPLTWEKREYAFATFGADGKGPFLRHRSFRDLTDLRTAMSSLVPRHTYYSTAMYANPANLSMKDKLWEGAEVVFDIDADHLRDAEGLSYPGQLDLAKKSFTYLLDEFLLGDFGIDERNVDIVFSGGRGYHAHVRSQEFEALTSGERRELVDYVMGVGFNPGEAYFFVGEKTQLGRVREFRRLHSPDERGWRGRLSRAVIQWTREIDGLNEDEVGTRVLTLFGQGTGLKDRKLRALARSVARDLSRPESQRAIVERQKLEAFHDEKAREVFLAAISRTLSVPLQGETDAPVTTDVHRLIRMPGSLHGGTGFVAKPLTRRQLDHFDPSTEALASTAAPDRVAVEFLQDVSYPFPTFTMAGREGKVSELPAPHALFLLLRGEARVPDLPGSAVTPP